MSIPNNDATEGAEPPAAMSVDPGCHVAISPPDLRAARAVWTALGSGPNSVAYCSAVTVLPAARSLASRSRWRTLRPRLRSTWVVAPAGPRSRARLIAVARRGAGEVMTIPAGGAGLEGCGELHAEATAMTRATSAPNPFINPVSRFGPVKRWLPTPPTRKPARIRASDRRRMRGCDSSRLRKGTRNGRRRRAAGVALRPPARRQDPWAGALGPCQPSSERPPAATADHRDRPRPGRGRPLQGRRRARSPSMKAEAAGRSSAPPRFVARTANDRQRSGCGLLTIRPLRRDCRRAAHPLRPGAARGARLQGSYPSATRAGRTRHPAPQGRRCGRGRKTIAWPPLPRLWTGRIPIEAARISAPRDRQPPKSA